MKKIILTTILTVSFISIAVASSLEEFESRTGKKLEGFTSREQIVSGVPTGAIMAFDLGGGCPSGWSKWSKASGRVIVGTGKRDNDNYRNYQIGGNSKITISAENIKKGKTETTVMSIKVKEDQTPPYVAVADTSVVSKECIERDKHCSRFPERPYTVDIGIKDAKPVDIRQPFIALTYCRKN